jgi:PKD repeat protein
MKNFNRTLLQTSMIIGVVSFSSMCGEVFAQQQIQKKPASPKITMTAGSSDAQLRKMMKADGLTDPEIDKIIAGKKLFLEKYKGTMTVSQKLKKGGGPNPVPYACTDLGVESGWSLWEGAPGTNNGSNPGTLGPPAAPAAPRFNLTSGAGIDPCTPGINPGDPTIPVVCPGFGGSSIQLGEPETDGCFIEQLSFPFTPTAQDTNLVYAFAAVLYDPPHQPNEKPYVEFKILDASGDTVPCSFQKYLSDPGQPGWYTANATCTGSPQTYYKPWTIVGVNLSAYVGQTLTCVIDNHDCVFCGHYAHSYWDVQCGPVPLAAGCVGNQSSITGPASDPSNPYTYQWYNNGVIMSGQTNQTVLVTPAANDTFSVHVMQPSGCDFYLTYAPAIVTPDFNFTGKCGNYVFVDSSFATPSTTASITGWSWGFPGGTVVSGANTPTVNVTYPPGTYNVTLTITSSAGCTASITQPITVGGFPTAAIIPSTPCLGAVTTLVDGSVPQSGDPIAGWNWMMPGGVPATDSTPNTSTLYSTPGVHTVTLVVTSAQGCIDTVPQQVIVYNPPVANFSAPDSGCAPVCANYFDNSSATDGTINGWQWSFPGGTPLGSALKDPTNICYYTSGNYSTSLVVTTNYGCKDTIQLPMIKVYPWPTADFCVAPTIAPITAPVFNFCDMWSSDVVQWSWNFGDNDSDFINTDPIHSYSASAIENDFYSYNICIEVENQYGCWDTTCKIVELVPEYTFYIPNTFTPNGDFMNELFYGKSRGVKEYNIWVFDRWGNQVWDCEYTDKNTNWDSDASNPKQEGLSSYCKWDGVVVKGGVDMGGGSKQLAQEDVYVWKVRLTDIFDKKHLYVGHVNVVR